MNTQNEKGKNLEIEISNMLRKLGIPDLLSGYKYLSTAILLCIKDISLFDSIIGKLYPAIAKKYSTSWKSIERAIRHAIEIGWEKADQELICSIFGNTLSHENKRPSNSTFIATIVEELRPKDELESKISNMLRKFGIPCSLSGFKYLSTAILLCIKDISLLDSITEKLHPALAKKYDTSCKNIRRSIFHAIDIGWEKADLELICSMFGNTLSHENKKPSSSTFIVTIVEELRPKDELESKISNILCEFGIPCSLCGFKYLSNAILLCIKDISLLDSIIGKLYPTIAKKYSTSWTNIERAIRLAIEIGWKKADQELICSMFGNTLSHENKRPSNSTFIATIVEELRPKDELESKISNMLQKLGIPCSLCGFKYLSNAILLCIKDISLLDSIIGKLYLTIAKKYGTSRESIERAIFHAIEIGWEKANHELICSMSGNTISYWSKKPSNSTFISTIVEKLNVNTF